MHRHQQLLQAQPLSHPLLPTSLPCSLGAGAAALVSLKLRESFPGLKCLAFCCPGGLVSKNLAHAMRRFTTCGG